MVPEPQHSKTCCKQTLITPSVVWAIQVLSTIDLDNQPPFNANKIKHVVQGGVLAPKLVAAKLPAPQTSPKRRLCFSHVVP